MKQIFFCPDQWRMDATVPTGVAAITEVTGFDGKTTEAWQLGNWQYDWSTIRTDIVLEPGEEYTKEDGTVGASYNSKKVFDISQTTAKVKDRPAMKRDERLLLKAIIHNAPCPIEISQKLPENINAVYRPDDKKIYVRSGLEAGDIFRGISQELAHAHLDDGAYKRSDHAFTAYCVSYVLCSRYNVPKDMFRFDRLPEGFSTMDARSVRNELSKIRDVANEISSDMAKVLDKSMKPKERRDEAR